MALSIAVLMAAYNADATLRQAVDSVCASTIPIQLFIVDDGSRVPVADLLGPMEHVEVIRLARNQGLAHALNAGLEEILTRGYEYVARMDADDICYPDRFARQLVFLKENPAIHVVGCGVRFIDDRSDAPLAYYCPAFNHEDIRQRLFFNNCMPHPGLVIRADVFATIGLYSLAYPAAEDYEFLRRVTRRFRVANVPECLLDYRISTTGISITKRRRQLIDRLRIQTRYFEPLAWRAWAGVAATLAMFAVPKKWIDTALPDRSSALNTKVNPTQPLP
jgi:glycosyltransferase involved in cell wall biosynthesis